MGSSSRKRCLSFTRWRDRYYRYAFSRAGLKSTTTDLGEGSIMHCWAPKAHDHSAPSLVLIHGIGANAMWQWNHLISPLTRHFNVYVPDLLFFGDSHTTRAERSEWFQAECVMALLHAHRLRKMSLVGLSYGGFVAYAMAAMFPHTFHKVVLCSAGVCFQDRDMEQGMFHLTTVDQVVNLLLPQTPHNVRELLRLTFANPIKFLPTCFLNDFIQVMCTEHRQEKKELIQALHKDRKLSNLPKITQPTQIMWGEKDQIFPLELAHSLKRHIGENAQLVVIKNAGHAINIEKPNEMYKNLKSFLIDP